MWFRIMYLSLFLTGQNRIQSPNYAFWKNTFGICLLKQFFLHLLRSGFHIPAEFIMHIKDFLFVLSCFKFLLNIVDLQCCVSVRYSKVMLVSRYSKMGTSLVAQWLRIHLPMQGTRVQALVREDPTCRGATKPVCHNCWACALEPASHKYWSPRT